MVDPSVIAAMRAAVAAAPDNTALRLHLASLLLESGNAVDALEQAALVLARQPADLEALKVASRAATEAHDERAEGYRRLLEALGGTATPPPPEADLPVTPPSVNPKDTPDTNANPRNLPVFRVDADSAEPPKYEPTGERLPVRVREDGGDEDPDSRWEVEGPKVTLADVAGMAEVKRRLNLALLAPMRNPELMKLYGRSLRGGLLLYGPPGCGKTFIARATAGELGARFLSVGLSDVLDMWLGQSEKNLHELFETARKKAPCVLFFDEADALGRKRSQMRNSAGNVINQLLAEMDGANADNEGVFILAATNSPWDVDTALRRPGRLDRTLLVLPPDLPAREAILALGLRDRPTQGLDLAGIAAQTENFSGADLAHLVESAVELAMEDSINSGRVRPVTGADFKRALKEVKPSTGPWFDMARNYAMFANEGGAYDDLLEYLRSRKML